MTRQQWEDICVGFDEYSFQPATLCNFEEVINEYREALKSVLKDLEVLEILKNHLNYTETKDLDTGIIARENYNITIFKALHEEDFNKIKEWLDA